MRGGKLRIQTAAFCLFMFISLFYRRRYCFSGATEKAKGGWGGGRSCFAFVGTTTSFVIPPPFFLRPRDFSFLLFLFFTGWSVPLPPLPLISSLFFSLFLLFLFFSTPLYSRNTSRGNWQQRVVDRSFMDLGRSLWRLFLMIRLLFVGIVGSFLVSGMRPFLRRGREDRCESVLVETFVWMKGLGFFIIYNTLYFTIIVKFHVQFVPSCIKKLIRYCESMVRNDF